MSSLDESSEASSEASSESSSEAESSVRDESDESNYSTVDGVAKEIPRICYNSDAHW